MSLMIDADAHVTEPRDVWTDRLAALDEAGLWAQVVYPNVGGFGSQRFQAMPEEAMRLAYNDWPAEWCATDRRRLIGAMSIPFWDIEASVAEIERGMELGHRAIILTGEPQRWGLPDGETTGAGS